MTTCQRREGERAIKRQGTTPNSKQCAICCSKCQAPHKSTSPHLSLSMFGSSVRSGVQAIAAIDLPRSKAGSACLALGLRSKAGKPRIAPPHSRLISPTVDFFFDTAREQPALCGVDELEVSVCRGKIVLTGRFGHPLPGNRCSLAWGWPTRDETRRGLCVMSYKTGC